MTYELVRFNGVVKGVNSPAGFHRKGDDNPHWQDFRDWNAKQPVPLDLSDKPPEPIPVDVDADRIKEILLKKDVDITAAEVKEAVLKFLRKTVR